MSNKMLTACYKVPVRATEKNVLISLADQANDVDGSCYPSIDHICMRTSLSERAVRYALRDLEEKGILNTYARQKADGTRTSNIYFLTPAAWPAKYLSNPPACRSPAVVPENSSDPAPADKVTRHQPTGAPGTACPRTIIEPIVEPKSHPNPSKQSIEEVGAVVTEQPLLTGPEWLSACKATKTFPVSGDDPVYDYCERVGISDDIMRLHWSVFKRKRLVAKKRQRGDKGWREAFLRSVQDNWYQLWYFDSGSADARLTSRGQAWSRDLMSETS